MGIGERLAKFRKARGMTQAQVAAAVGVSEAAIRHYEHGIRMPKPELLEDIAEVLEVSASALTDYGIDSERDILEVLFRLEDIAGLRPVSTENGTHLEVDDLAGRLPDIRYALISWESKKAEFESGAISRDEYDEWRASFG